MEDFLCTNYTTGRLLNVNPIKVTGRRRKRKTTALDDGNARSDDDSDEDDDDCYNATVKKILLENAAFDSTVDVRQSSTASYLVFSCGASGRERLVSCSRHVGAIDDLANKTTVNHPSPWSLVNDANAYVETRRSLARSLCVDLRRVVAIPRLMVGEQVSFRVKGTDKPLIVFPVGSRKATWVAVARSMLQLGATFADAHNFSTDANPTRATNSRPDVRKCLTSKDNAVMQNHFLLLLLRFLRKLEGHGHTFFTPFSLAHASVKSDSAWYVCNNLFGLAVLGDSFRKDSIILADVLGHSSLALTAFAYRIRDNLNFLVSDDDYSTQRENN